MYSLCPIIDDLLGLDNTHELRSRIKCRVLHMRRDRDVDVLEKEKCALGNEKYTTNFGINFEC